MSASLVGSEMCIRDSYTAVGFQVGLWARHVSLIHLAFGRLPIVAHTPRVTRDPPLRSSSQASPVSRVLAC
eukprot:5082750-Alexandrium_andersonii.AAC.1